MGMATQFLVRFTGIAQMHKIGRWISIISLSCWLSVISSANSFGIIEIYAKVKSASDLCSVLSAALDRQANKPECKVIHQESGKVRLKWNAISRYQVQVWLDTPMVRDVLDWYEFNDGGFITHSLYTSAQQLGDLHSFNTLRPDFELGTPWFVTDSIKRLMTAQKIHDAYHPVVVAVIDSGVNFEGSLASAKKYTNVREVPGDGIDNDGNGYIDDVHGWDFVETGTYSPFDDITDPDNDPSDRLGHGTAVAAIIEKTVGSAFGPFLQIMPLRVASGSGGSGAVDPGALAEAIYYAADNGAQIVNISLGGEQNYLIIEEALNYAFTKGVKIVASAGNSAGIVMFPASIAGVLSVGATDTTGAIWSGSASGNGVDLYAPGVNMLANLGVYTFSLSSDGTSFSTPIVTGVFAMLLSLGRGGGVSKKWMIICGKCLSPRVWGIGWL